MLYGDTFSMEYAFTPEKLIWVKLHVWVDAKQVLFCIANIPVYVLVDLNAVTVISLNSNVFISSAVTRISFSSIPRCSTMTLQIRKLLRFIATNDKKMVVSGFILK